MVDVGILICHLVYFMATWYILWPVCIFYDYLVYFFPVLVCCAEKNLAALPQMKTNYKGVVTSGMVLVFINLSKKGPANELEKNRG
jgi:hypothetical protein